MTYNRIMHRSGLTAIAAVLALSSTPALAQDALAPEPLAETTADSIPLAEPATPVTTTTTIETTTEVVSDPLAPEAQVATAPAAASTRRTTIRRTATVARPATVSPVPAPSVITTAPMAPMVEPILAAPISEIAPVAIAPPADTPVVASDDTLPIAGAAGLGLLALLGAGAALRRRKRREAGEFVTADYVEPAFAAAPARAEPVQAIAPRAPLREPVSAFGWNGAPAAASGPAGSPLLKGIDAAKHGRHVVAAYRGPSADNPSLSLKTRIKRAAFFDQRERLVAKGKAAPIAASAGLPSALAKQAARARDAATARAPRPMNVQPRLQPAWSN